MRKETSNKEAVYSCFLNGLPPHHDSLWAFFSGCYCILVCPVFYTFAFFPDFFLHVCFTVLYFILTLELLYDDLLFLFTPYDFSLPVQPTSKRCQVMLNHNFWLQLPSFYLFEKEYLNQIFVCFQSKYNLFFLCRWWCGTCFRLFQRWAVSIKLESFIGNEWKNIGLIPPHQSSRYLGCLPSVLD